MYARYSCMQTCENGTPGLAATRSKGTLDAGRGGFVVIEEFEVSVGKGTYDAYALAFDCWDAWNDYLESKGLVTVRLVPPVVPPRR